MKKTVFAIFCTLIGTGVAAGDQPVIPFPTLPPVYKRGDMVFDYMYSQGPGSIYNHATTTIARVGGAGNAASPNGLATQASGSGPAPKNPVYVTGDDAIYQSLLAEAKARGLR